MRMFIRDLINIPEAYNHIQFQTHIFKKSSFAVQCTCKGGFLLSNVYTVLEVVDEKELISQYLMLWFSRPEFDRFARFKSHGSVRNKTQS